MEFKEMSLEELEALRTAISEEIARRKQGKMVLYTHDCKDAARHHLGKYKHWAKLIKSVDVTKTNGYAFGGEFLKVTDEHMVPEGSVIVEVCGDDIVAYRMTSDGAEVISKAKTNAMSSLIQEVAKAL